MGVYFVSFDFSSVIFVVRGCDGTKGSGVGTNVPNQSGKNRSNQRGVNSVTV